MIHSDEFFIDKLFEPSKIDSPMSESDYHDLKIRIDCVEKIAHANNMSVYIIDYLKKAFLYVSPNPLFLCGYDREEVRKMGYKFYTKVVAPEDKDLLLEINEKSFDFFYKQPPEERYHLSISFDFRVLHANKMEIMIHHKQTPFVLTDAGDLWLSICFVTLSTRKKSGNAIFQKFDSPERWEYSLTTKKWKKTSAIKLTKRESEIFRLSAQGYAIKNISIFLGISESTVNFHKTNIFSKLNVTNIAEAVYYGSAISII